MPDNLDKRVTVLETSFPLLIKELQKEFSALRVDINQWRTELSSIGPRAVNNESKIRELEEQLEEQGKRQEEHNKEDKRFHEKIERILYGLMGVGGFVSVAWTVFTFFYDK